MKGCAQRYHLLTPPIPLLFTVYRYSTYRATSLRLPGVVRDLLQAHPAGESASADIYTRQKSTSSYLPMTSKTRALLQVSHGAAPQMYVSKREFFFSKHFVYNIRGKIPDLCEKIIFLIYYKLSKRGGLYL